MPVPPIVYNSTSIQLYYIILYYFIFANHEAQQSFSKVGVFAMGRIENIHDSPEDQGWEQIYNCYLPHSLPY